MNLGLFMDPTVAADPKLYEQAFEVLSSREYQQKANAVPRDKPTGFVYVDPDHPYISIRKN